MIRIITHGKPRPQLKLASEQIYVHPVCYSSEGVKKTRIGGFVPRMRNQSG